MLLFGIVYIFKGKQFRENFIMRCELRVKQW